MVVTSDTGLLVPMELSAFVLNEKVCAAELDVKIAPIVQPNYTFLRLSNNLIVPDIQDQHDLTQLSPASVNPRVYDIAKGQPRLQRFGVHLHWSLPRAYRAGETRTTSVPSTTNNGVPAAPRYRNAPNRYLVIRRLASFSPPNASIRSVQAFVVESDRLTRIDDFPDDFDLETKVAPFIRPNEDMATNPQAIEEQAEIFLGKCTPLENWQAADADAARQRGDVVGDFSLLSSSNPLFADFAPHNCGVFSMIDNFECLPGSPVPFLTSATVDYVVLGWHTDMPKDLFSKDQSLSSHETRLGDCAMQLKQSLYENNSDLTKSIQDWLGSSDGLQVLIHGSKYGVQYDRDSAPSKLLGHEAATKLTLEQPIAVGSTAIDAILAFCRAHEDPSSTEDIPKLESDILKLQTLLRASSDDLDGHQQAFDLLSTQSYLAVDGGNIWQATEKSPADNANPIELQTFRDSLASLNAIQRQLDAAHKEAKVLRWRLYAYWWNFASSRNQQSDASAYVQATADIRDRLFALTGSLNPDGSKVQGQEGLVKKLQDAINQARTDGGLFDSKDAAKDKMKLVTTDRFYTQNDPTILFGGLKSPWVGYLSKLPVRLTEQALPGSPNASPQWQPFRDYVNGISSRLAVPGKLFDSISRVLIEFETLSAAQQPVVDGGAPSVIPYFHDTQQDIGARDQWRSTQPWFPLFFEWEAMYVHVDFDDWSLASKPTRLPNTVNQIRYGIDRDFRANPSALDDVRTVSGRNLILPQPSYSLAAVVQQILNGTKKDDLEALGLDESEQTRLRTKISSLDFISSPLSGLTSHLQTLHQGMHVKPVARVPGQSPMPIQAAIDATARGFPDGWARLLVSMIDAESAVTPYGNSVSFPRGDVISPQKTATHGQLFFTKLNIIDRFGQAVSAIKPERWRKGKDIGTVLRDVKGINPCVGDAFAIDPLGSGDDAHPNSAIPEPHGSACRSITMLPSINQPARLNGVFVVPGSDGHWRPCEAWENPIWGWVVVNYANYGLQFFTAEGSFYREIRMGGKNGAVAGLKWLPFDPSVVDRTSAATRLDEMIQWLVDPTDSQRIRLHAFFDMVNDSVRQGATHPPDAYASVMTAAIGKPLALVNSGWSIELADDEYQSWSTLATAKSDRSILSGNGPKTYDFAVQFGDVERWYDGLVCYWPSSQDTTNINFNEMNTFFMDTTTSSSASAARADADPGGKPSLSDPRRPITTTTYPRLQAFFDSPQKSFDPSKTGLENATAYNTQRNKHMHVMGIMMDPYHSVHGYSGILPIKALRLPPWTLTAPMERMTAFFHVGPIVVTRDVPSAYDSSKALTADYNLKDTDDYVRKDERNASERVAIPVVGTADWNWLQPYVTDTGTRYNLFDIDQHAGSAGAGGGSASEMRLEKGPYTALEGYLQLKQSLLRD